MTLDKITSFRMDDIILQKLSHEARQKQISLNRLVHIILHDHVDLKSEISRGGFIGIRRTVLSKLLESATDKKMIEIAHHVAEVEGKEILLSLRSNLDDTSTVDWLENWLKISGYQYKHDILNSNSHYYLVYHNMGYKWSVYLSHVWGIILKKMFEAVAEFEVTDHSVSFKISSNQVHHKIRRRGITPK